MVRKRRSKGTWFPVLGSVWSSGDDSYHDSNFTLTTATVPPVRATGPTFSGPYAVTKDYTLEPGDDVSQEHSLRDYVNGQDWLLQRLVGKFHVRCFGGTSTTTGSAWYAVRVTAGFFVARAEQEDQATCELEPDETDPSAVDNIQDPWIWRRTWLLRNPAIFGTGSSAPGDFPVANAVCGSALDGPHIDSRVKRRISREHRLWVVMAAQGWNGAQTDVTGLGVGQQPGVAAHLDLRIYGSLRRAKNTSSF